MSHFGDFMDGVPVKISEKYIRPPKIELPYSVVESTVRAQNVVDGVKYCSTFEKNVLAKLAELRSAKETKKNERRHRLQLLEEAKQRKLDEIAAAEAEEKLKQLSVSEVSYPSTEEIREISPDDKTDKNCDTTLTQEDKNEFHPEIATNTEPIYLLCSNQQDPQLNILQPIQVQSNYQQKHLLDDVDPLQELKLAGKPWYMAQYNPGFSNRNIDTLTFKDFENDTSSPFDNVELKTINEMEQLAQVLQSERESTSSCYPQQHFIPEHTYSGIPNCSSQAHVEGIAYLPNAYVDQPVQGASMMYASTQHYPVANGYYIPSENCENIMPMDNVNLYIPNMQYYAPANPYLVNPAYYNQQTTVVAGETTQASNEYIPQPYYFNYPQVRYHYPLANQTTGQPTQNEAEPANSNPSTSTIKSRSRSVPDIVRELNEEVLSAKLRANERSYNASPAPKEIPRPTSSRDKKEGKRSRRKSEHLPNPFDKLSVKLQAICRSIHGMGFPLDRVARVCTLVGESDKKIIEGLLIMGELMDLGFSEGRVSAALAKHEFNKDKALDELVS